MSNASSFFFFFFLSIAAAAAIRDPVCNRGWRKRPREARKAALVEEKGAEEAVVSAVRR